MRAYLIGHVNKFVSGLAHRRNDRHDTMTTAMQIGKTARDRADFRRCFKTGAAVFLHDDGVAAHSTYRNTLRAAQMPARTHRDMRPRATWNTNATAAHAQPVANPAPCGHRPKSSMPLGIANRIPRRQSMVRG